MYPKYKVVFVDAGSPHFKPAHNIGYGETGSVASGYGGHDGVAFYPQYYVTPMGGIGGFNYNSVGQYMRHRHKTITTHVAEHESGSASEAASGQGYAYSLSPFSSFWKK